MTHCRGKPTSRRSSPENSCNRIAKVDPGPTTSSQQLTARQREVLQLIAEGHSAKQIAAVLKVSVRTAEAHKAHIMEALELRSTAELVQYAIRNGIISID